jgi:protein farnesyltransferase subunit beta
MPLLNSRRKVRFQSQNQPPSASTTNPKPKMTRPGIPVIFTQPPAICDPLDTETTDLQTATREKCLPFLKGTHSSQSDHNEHGVPALKRDLHVAYLYDSLEDYPAGFVAMDASRPWMVYWGLAGFAMLGEDTSIFRDRWVAFVLFLFFLPCRRLMICRIRS